MRYLICRKQDGEGCDYTIGCGMAYGIIEADDIEDAIDKTIWPEGKDEYSALENENALVEILIVPVSSIIKVNIDEYAKEVERIRKREHDNKIFNEERAEYERLKNKFGDN